MERGQSCLDRNLVSHTTNCFYKNAPQSLIPSVFRSLRAIDALKCSKYKVLLTNSQQNLIVMKAPKSVGCSTKATSIFASLSPLKGQKQPFSQFDQLQSRELLFYKVKNRQLQEGALRLAENILELEQSNEQLLKINQRYISTLNEHFKKKHSQFEQQMKQVKGNSHPFCKHCNRSILIEFQKDYRNLVKYTMVLKDQIASKNKDLHHYLQIKHQLSQTNHSQISTLIAELAQTTGTAIQLKKDLNKVEFQAEKLKAQLQKIKKNSKASKNSVNHMEEELQKYQSLIKTIQNQCIDKQRALNQKIYQQEVLIQSLEKNLRDTQIEKLTVGRKRQQLRIENLQLTTNLRQTKRSFSQSKSNINKNHKQQNSKQDLESKLELLKL